MNKEEIKEYLQRVEELELKLVGEDRDTLQWLIFGYNECARLLNEAEEENKLLKHRLKTANDFIESRKGNMIPEHYDDLKYIINECDLNSSW